MNIDPSDLKFIIMQQTRAINDFVNNNLKNKDEEGYAFLSNVKKGESMPFEFAYSFSFKQPIFKIKIAKRTKHIEDRAYDILCCTHESVWVKEGLE